MADDSVPPLNYGDLILSFQQQLRVEVAVASNLFVKVLLLAKLRFRFDVFLLKLADQVVL